MPYAPPNIVSVVPLSGDRYQTQILDVICRSTTHNLLDFDMEPKTC